MKDFMNRCATILACATIVTWALALQMSSNGYAHVGNPAWVLILTARWLCTVIVVTAIAMFIIKANVERELELARRREEAEKRRQETKLNEERRKQWEIEYAQREQQRRIREEFEAAERLHLAAEKQRLEQVRREREEAERRARSADDAVAKAFNDFI